MKRIPKETLPLTIVILLAPIVFLSSCDNSSSSTPVTSTPSSVSISPATPSPTPTTIRYLAVNSDVPAPEDPVPVGDQATMQSLIAAAQSQDRAKYNEIATSPSVSLIPGGAIVEVISTSGNLVQVKLNSFDIKDNDLSGQVRWTYSEFIQSRQIQF